MVPDRIRSTLQDPLRDLGLVIEDLTITPAGKRSVLRIAVDDDLADVDPLDDHSPIPPLTLDDVADATRAISDALDASDVTGSQPYVLEVSSPGVGRPLTSWRQWRRNVGRLVTVTGLDGTTTQGRIVRVDESTATVRPTSGVDVVVGLADVRRARIDVEFARLDDLDDLDEFDEDDALDDDALDEDALEADDSEEETPDGH